jgi:pyrroline-5-carboxylate reductase
VLGSNNCIGYRWGMEALPPILLIGGGQMGAALAACWRDRFDGTAITIAETHETRRAELRAQGFDAPDELEVPEDGFGIVVLAVKPQGFAQLRPALEQLVGNATLVSIMAGIDLAALQHITEFAARVMPNTPATIGEGMSAICAPGLPDERLADVKALFSAAGHVVMIDDEAQMHAVTAISGSGPAYVFAFMEALEDGAKALGLDATTARALVMQTVRGATLLADQQGGDAARLRAAVTSPGGTTQAALEQLQPGLTALLLQSVKAAAARSKILAKP